MRLSRPVLLLLAGGLLAAVFWPRRRLVSGQRIMRISRVVADLDRAAAFYRDALGFRIVSRGPTDATALQALGVGDTAADEVVMQLGETTVALVQFVAPGRPYPPASQADDLWFQHLAIVVSDMDAACDHLARTIGWEPISHGGPQLLPPSNGSVRAFKFRDPDGHPLELIWFPSVAAAPDAAAMPTFLCVDHSALSVASTPRSVSFYRALGFQVSARSFNHGPAQSRLDGLSDARVRVTGLGIMAGAKPGLELLGYQPPGRPCGVSSADDVVTDWVTILVSSLGGDRIRAARDPDGHRLLLVDQGSGLPV